MSTTNPTLPVLIKILVDLIIGAIIRSAANVAAKAQTVVAVCAAIIQINTGNATAGITALDAALATITDPAEAAALLSAVNWLAQKATALAALGGGTILGTLNTQLLIAVCTEATTVAQAYIPAATK